MKHIGFITGNLEVYNNELIVPVNEGVIRHTLGKKLNELTNHLGNVLSVVSDYKIPYNEQEEDETGITTVSSTELVEPLYDDAGNNIGRVTTGKFLKTEKITTYSLTGSVNGKQITQTFNSLSEAKMVRNMAINMSKKFGVDVSLGDIEELHSEIRVTEMGSEMKYSEMK